MQTCTGGHDQKSHGDGNYGAHELDPNPVDGCHGGELMQVCLTTFFLYKKIVSKCYCSTALLVYIEAQWNRV